MKYDMLIFDRWGMEIFHTTDKDEGWNGKVQGHDTPCLIDVYVYMISAWDAMGYEHQYIGRVSIVR
jgi:hypothetical protein